MDKNSKQIRAFKAKQDEAILGRLLVWLAGGAALEFLLLLLNRYYFYYNPIDQLDLALALRPVVRVVAVVALVCAAGLAVRWYSVREHGKKCFWYGAGAVFLLGLSFGCFATWLVGHNGLRFSYVAVPVTIVLVLVYHLYQREFFFQSCCAALALMGVWVIGNGSAGMMRPFACGYAVLAVVLILVGAFVCWKAQGNRGKLPFKGKTMNLFSKDTNYTLLYTGAVVNTGVLIAAVLTMVLPLPLVVLYGVAVAWVLIMAVYYTVKII